MTKVFVGNIRSKTTAEELAQLLPERLSEETLAIFLDEQEGNTLLGAHINHPTPHPAYDDVASYAQSFRAALI